MQCLLTVPELAESLFISHTYLARFRLYNFFNQERLVNDVKKMFIIADDTWHITEDDV